MFEWLIKLLGGYTALEYNNLDAALESWRARVLGAESNAELVKGLLTQERERSERLMDHIIHPRPEGPRSEITAPNMQPIGNTISSWPRIRRKLEFEHRVKEEIPTKEEVQSSAFPSEARK
jgi:hypothetical protein